MDPLDFSPPVAFPLLILPCILAYTVLTASHKAQALGGDSRPGTLLVMAVMSG